MNNQQRSILRKKGHEGAKKLMSKGDFSQASQALLETYIDHGPHVGLLCDLAASFYVIENHDQYSHFRGVLFNEYETQREFLSYESRFKTALFIGKLHEDEGRITDALNSYDEALGSASSLSQQQLAEVQILRLKSYFNITGLEVLYRHCLRHSQGHTESIIELEHGLILAEIRLFGLSIAHERLGQLLSSHSLNPSDLNLVIFDFLEEAMLCGQLETYSRLIESVSMEQIDYFERHLYALLKGEVVSISAINQVAGKMSFANLIRLHLLVSVVGKGSREFERRAEYLLNSLNQKDQKFYISKFREAGVGQGSLVIYDVRDSTMYYSERNLKFKEGSFQDLCFQAFMGRSKMPIEEFVSIVFSCEWNETYYHRVRMGLTRLNQTLAPILGRTQVFRLTKSDVYLESLVINPKGSE